MKAGGRLRIAGLSLLFAFVAVVSGGHGAESRDLWVHPRGDAYDAKRHYRDASGELYYKAENDLLEALGDVAVERVDRPLISVQLGPELWDVAEDVRGTLLPIFLWDSDGDDIVDRSVRGSVDGEHGVFDSPALDGVDLRTMRWQLGIRYIAGFGGDRSLDGRYLASVDSRNARVAYRRISEFADVAAAPGGGALIILKHREGKPFDLADFVDHPVRYIEDFDALTPAEDADDWTVNGDATDGKLVTHFEEENLFIVRTQEGFSLDLEWGDLPILSFLKDHLKISQDIDGCYSSLHTQLVNDDGSPTVIPHRLLYCPQDSIALFDAPPGYQLGLSAKRNEALVEHTNAGTSIPDNARLYIREIYPRHPSARATGSVTGNIEAGFVDARADLKDVFRHGFSGTGQTNIHTGRRGHRASPVTALPRALFNLALFRPGQAVDELVNGVESAVQVGADVMSAVGNGVVNPIIQVTVGNAASPQTANKTGDWFGAFLLAVAKNVPGGERANSGINPMSTWRHNRAFGPMRFTRTDTQLNIDRFMTIFDFSVLSAISRHNSNSSGDGVGGNGPKGPKGPKVVCPNSRGAPRGNPASPARSARAISVLTAKFCHHPTLDGLLPVKFF